MKRWIRWNGLFVFAAAVIVIALVWVLLVDAVLRRGIEIVGTRAVGAKVDLVKADLSLFPAGLELTGLAVTNPESPMQNAVEIKTIKMDLDLSYLIRRKVIIETMQVTGLALDTPRKVSGEIAKADKTDSKKETAGGDSAAGTALKNICGDFTMPSFSKPDIEAILKKEPLASIQLARDLEKKIAADKKKWEAALARLADEKTLQDYRARIEKLKDTKGSLTGILGAAGDAKTLREDISKDLGLLKEARTALTEDLGNYRRQVDDLARAPVEEAGRLARKYSLTSSGLGNLSQLIFGQRLCGWMGTVARWYEKIRSYLDKLPTGNTDEPTQQKPLRGKGLNIRFAETPPMPDFLIRTIDIGADLTAGTFSGTIQNATLDQYLLGSPTTFAFKGKNMAFMDALNLSGTANYVNPGNPRNDARLTLKGLGLANLQLIDEEAFPLVVKTAIGDLDLDLKTVNEVMNAALSADFDSVQFVSDTGKKELSAIADAMVSAIAGIDRFSLNADAEGTLMNYAIRVNSDLDRVLKSAVGNLVRSQSGKIKAALADKIGSRLKGPMEIVTGSLAGLDGLYDELTRRLNLGDELLNGLKLPL